MLLAIPESYYPENRLGLLLIPAQDLENFFLDQSDFFFA